VLSQRDSRVPATGQWISVGWNSSCRESRASALGVDCARKIQWLRWSAESVLAAVALAFSESAGASWLADPPRSLMQAGVYLHLNRANVSLALLPIITQNLMFIRCSRFLSLVFPPTVYHRHILLLIHANKRLVWPAAHVNASWNMPKRACVQAKRSVEWVVFCHHFMSVSSYFIDNGK
jgi:hypothetical protein